MMYITERENCWRLAGVGTSCGEKMSDMRGTCRALGDTSLLRETFWGAVSELRSTIDFDYASYTRDYLQRLDAAWALFKARS